MKNIFKELKPFTLIIILIIGLLFFQAMTELALPDYMSRIVDVGIQQNGIDETIPKVIRASEVEKLKIFLDEEEKSIFDNSHKLISKTNLNENEYKNYLKEYPLLEKESLYILDTENEEDIERLNDFLGKAILIKFGMEMDLSEMMPGDSEIPMENPFDEFPEGVDPFTVLENMPKEQLNIIKEKIDESYANLPEMIIVQSKINYIKGEYEAIGINLEKTQSSYILSIGGIMLLIALIGMVASIAVGFFSSRVGASLGKNLRHKVFQKVTAFSSAEFDKFSTASLITRSTNDIQQIQTLMIVMFRIVFYAPILGVGGVIRALDTNVSMAWIVGLGVVAITILVGTLFIIAMPRFKKLQKLVDKINLVTREALSGLMVVRAFNTQDHERKKFDRANKELTKTNLFVSRVMVFMMPTMMFIMNGIMILIIWVGAKEIDAGAMQVGDMMAFMQYAMQIIMSFLMISMISIMLPRAMVSATRVGEILNTELEIQDPENPVELKGETKGLVEFKNVSFRYPGAEKCVLDNISFTAKPGETTAFIGSTGSGKSTLLNLIPRLYDVVEGEILLDGVNIKNMKLHDLREQIGYTPQKSMLFKGSIESNIKYGKNADISNEDVLRAIEISQAKEFVQEREEGVEAPISQGGVNVSGGQKQRLSIARALAKKPKVLIFDDSFSALDFKTDADLRKAMKKEGLKSTVLVVAQRINTIVNAEKIIVLDECKIVGEGTHKELLKTSDIYRQIALSQLSEEELQDE